MMKEQKTVRRMLGSNLLKSDPDYQRQVDMKRVNEIVNGFDVRLIGQLTVSHRGGKFFIVDGQHRYEALKILNQGKEFPVECNIFEGLTKIEEAMFYAKMNKCAKPLTRLDELKALSTGKDERIMRIVTLVRQAGLEVSFTSSTNADNKIAAIVKLEKIYSNMDEVDFVNMLKAIKKAWDGDEKSLVKEMLGGMHVFYKTYKGQFDEQKLIEKLSAVPPLTLIRDGKALLLRGDKKFALKIVRIYNYKNRFKLDENLLVF